MALPLSWAGVYDSDGVWDLSGPVTANRTLGDVVTDLLIEEIVKRAGVPSLLEEKAQDAVREILGVKVKTVVDATAPAPLRPDSELMKKLATVLAGVDVKSTIELLPGPRPGSVNGTEELRSFTFAHQGRRTALPAGSLLERTVPLVTIGADRKGKELTGGALAIERAPYEVRLGKMILWLVDNVLEESGATSLSQAAATAVDCNAVVARALDGKTELTFGVSVASYSVGASALQGACAAATGLVKTKVLGLFDLDTGVELGGDVQVLDADRLRSKDGYGGILAVVRASLAPRVTVRFEATRRPGPHRPSGAGPHYADIGNAIGTTARLPIRGRIIQVTTDFDPAITTPFAQISQQEMPGEPVTIVAGTRMLAVVTTDGEGYIDQAIDLAGHGLPPGNHLLQFLVRGRIAGTASARLLAPEAAAVVVRSDVDLIYLDTDFMSTTGKLSLLVERGAERDTLPGLEAVYRTLRRGASSAEDVPLTFLSGSPGFFKMVLEEKMRLDRIAQDGVVLKPFKDIVATKLADVDLAGIVPALEEQVGYKLTALLRLRLDVPPQTQEILLGDDSEADAVAYLLYHQLTSRQVTVDGLLARLDAIPVDSTWKAVAAELAPRVVAMLPPQAPVIAIYINQTGKPNPRFPVAAWIAPGVTRYHTGAWPLALDLFEEARLSGPAVNGVKARLLELGQTAATLAAAAQTGVTAGFLRPQTVSAF